VIRYDDDDDDDDDDDIICKIGTIVSNEKIVTGVGFKPTLI
jgi:hypothetical protein